MTLQVDVTKKLFAPRVEDTVKRLASGDSYKEAARELQIDAETVKSYATAFRRIMQAKNTAEAVAKAIARGVISIKEIDSKTLIACGFICLSSFQSDFVMARVARTSRAGKKHDAITQSQDGGQMADAWLERAGVRFVVPAGLSAGAVWEG